MKTNTIKWRIFKNNLIVIIILISLTTIVFNIAVRIYIEKDILGQLDKIALRTEDTALQKGPDFFKGPGPDKTPPPKKAPDEEDSNDLFRYYFMLDRSLRESLSVLNADYILFDSSKNIITPSQEEYFKASENLLKEIKKDIDKPKKADSERYISFNVSNIKYIALIKPVSQKNNFGLGWIVIYSNLQKLNQLQLGINIILFAILIFSAAIIIVFSSRAAKTISAPLSSMNNHIRAIAERNFDIKIQMTVDDEYKELINNINIMSEKLETYDKAQKTFLQNVSHEFRTPIMSIQSYAEGIKYDVVEGKSAADIIIDESKRLTHLVEDVMYLSRLDTIEESYYLSNLDFQDLVNSCVERMSGIAIKENKEIIIKDIPKTIKLIGDEEKLSRALTNIISNCIRYADSTIIISSKMIENGKIELSISDDGPGFDINELPNIFERFYKGKKGNIGLGLSIAKNIVEKHNGKITAENTELGAMFKIVLPIS